jgi:hypothetical protein
MQKSRNKTRYPDLGEKDCWNLYSLQVLTPNKFVKVVGNVLDGRYLLVAPKSGKKVAQ